MTQTCDGAKLDYWEISGELDCENAVTLCAVFSRKAMPRSGTLLGVAIQRGVYRQSVLHSGLSGLERKVQHYSSCTI